LRSWLQSQKLIAPPFGSSPPVVSRAVVRAGFHHCLALSGVGRLLSPTEEQRWAAGR
jgi:hypothetical protein